MTNNRSRRRKRNKSSPLVESSPKKTRNLQKSTDTQTLCEAESGAEPQSQSLLQTPDNRKAIDPTTVQLPPSPADSQSDISEEMHESELLTQSPAHHGPGPAMGQDSYSPHPSMMNPMYGIPSQLQPQMMGFQPAATPGLSKQDLLEIAQMVKSMLQDEISEQVKLKVAAATKSLQTELNTTKTELNNTKDALVNMKTLVDDLQSKVSNLELKQDEAEQYSRRMCLRISGIAESNNEDVTKKVLDFAATVNSTITARDIDRAHRVGAPSTTPTPVGGATATAAPGTQQKREIIIKFTNSSARLNLLQGRAVLRTNNINGIFITEDLTPARKKLAFECRRIKRKPNSEIKKVWIYAGYPHIQDASGKKLKITCMDDLKDYDDANEPIQQPAS